MDNIPQYEANNLLQCICDGAYEISFLKDIFSISVNNLHGFDSYVIGGGNNHFGG